MKHEIKIKDINYGAGTTGYLAYPSEGNKFPGIVAIHEWWGLNDNIKESTRKLAGEGYTVLAVDLYGKTATTREEATKLKGELKQEDAVKNMQAAVRYLREKGASKVASLGWCFGGKQSLALALSGEKLDATVIYYGQVITDADMLSKISWPVLGVFGEEDQSIPAEDAKAFDVALARLSIEHSVHIYPGVGHAFTNPTGKNFAPKEAEDAWKKTLVFLEKSLC